MSLDQASIRMTAQDGIATLTIDRAASANALGPEVVRRMTDTVTGLGDEVSCLIIRSTGDVFSAGGDLSHLTELNAQGHADVAERLIQTTFQPLILALRAAPFPVIARVQGAAVGAGADLVLACDLRVASDQAWLREAWVNLGLMSALGAVPELLGAVGRGTASDLLMTGRRVNADECARLGLFQRVVPPDQLDAEVDRMAAAIAKRSRPAIRAIKAALWSIDKDSLLTSLAEARARQAELICSAEFGAAVAALAAQLASKQPGDR